MSGKPEEPLMLVWGRSMLHSVAKTGKYTMIVPEVIDETRGMHVGDILPAYIAATEDVEAPNQKWRKFPYKMELYSIRKCRATNVTSKEWKETGALSGVKTAIKYWKHAHDKKVHGTDLVDVISFRIMSYNLKDIDRKEF